MLTSTASGGSGRIAEYSFRWVEDRRAKRQHVDQPSRRSRAPPDAMASALSLRPDAEFGEPSPARLHMRSGCRTTIRRNHIDWGFSIDALYGMDYRFPRLKRPFSTRAAILGRSTSDAFYLQLLWRFVPDPYAIPISRTGSVKFSARFAVSGAILSPFGGN